MHWRSKIRTQSPSVFRVEPVTAGAPKVKDGPAELVKKGVYWIRLTDQRLTGSTGWQIARQCFDDKFMIIGMLVVLSLEDIAEIGPLVLPPIGGSIEKFEPPKP